MLTDEQKKAAIDSLRRVDEELDPDSFSMAELVFELGQTRAQVERIIREKVHDGEWEQVKKRNGLRVVVRSYRPAKLPAT